MADDSRKLVGTLYLDLAELKKNIKDANELLQSLGKGIDLTGSLKESVKQSMSALTKEIKSQSGTISRSFKSAFDSSSTSADRLLKEITTFGKDNSIRTVSTYINELGETIRETTKNGKVLSTSITTDGKQASQIREANALYKDQASDLRTLYGIKTKLLDANIGDNERQELESQHDSLTQIVSRRKQEIQTISDSAEKRKAQVSLLKQETDLEQKLSIAAKRSEYITEVSHKKEVISNLRQQADLTNSIYAIRVKSVKANETEQTSLNEIEAQYREQLRLAKNRYEEMLRTYDIHEDDEDIQAELNRLKEVEVSGTQKVRNAQEAHNQALKQGQAYMKQMITAAEMFVALMAVNALKNFWQEAIDYSSKYYDNLNEIRIVTQMSEEQANQLGASYRQMAKNLKVSSTEIASASVEFYRQGLGTTETNARTINTTQYAKISGLQFKEAAELVTSATNSMNLDSKRVVDMWAYLGDASASGADEIGKAMQRVSATADEAGISFEWLGAYIASLSEKTREAPESIGTALNSIVSRLQNIKQRGYNEEDATKINDVAKALSKINVAIMDQQNNWRDMSDIFLDIASQWGNIDDKMKSYIATTIAGTRQKNYFLTLMNDMSKMNAETGEGSRALELYYGALSSSGAASEKYAIYQQSVAAAQAEQNAALEEFHSKIDGSVIKGYYHSMASLIDLFDKGTDGAYALASGVGAVVAMITVLKTAMNFSKTNSIVTLFATLSKGKIVAILLGIAGAVATVTAAVGMLNKASNPEALDYSGAIESYNSVITNVTTLRNEYASLVAIENRTFAQEDRMLSIVKALAGTNNDLHEALTDVNGAYLSGEEALSSMNVALDGYIDRMRILSNAQAADNLRDTSAVKTAMDQQSNAQSQSMLKESFSTVKNNLGSNPADKDVLDYLEWLTIEYTGGYFTQDWNRAESLLSAWEKKMLDYWYSQGVTIEGINEFFKDYNGKQQDVIDKMTELDLLNTGEAEQNVRDAMESYLENYQVKFTNTSEYAQLPAQFQEAVRQMAKTFVKSLSSEQLSDSSSLQQIYDNAVDYFNEYYREYNTLGKMVSQYMKNMEAYDPNNSEHVETMTNTEAAINDLITSLNAKYGTSIPLLDTLIELSNVSNEATEEAEEQQTQVDSLYKTLSEGVLKNEIAKRSDAGWDKEIRSITEALESGDIDRIEKMAQAFSLEENAPWLEQMKSDLPFIQDMLFSLYDDSGALVPDPVNIEEALRIWYEGLDETEKKALSLEQTLKESLASQELEALTENGFASWFEEMSKFAESGDEAGLYGWLLGKDDKQRQAFIEAFPIFSEFLNSIAEGKGAVDESAESWALFSENIDNATNKYLEWIKAYKTSQENDVTDEEGRGLLGSLSLAYDKGGIKEYKKTFESMTDAQRDWIVKNSEAGKEMVEIMEDTTDATKDGTSAMKKMNREIGRMDLDDLVDAGDVWEDLPDMLDAAAKGGKDFSETYSNAVGEVEKLSEAQGALSAIQNGMLNSTDDLDDAYSTLASYTGLSADSLRNDLSPALWMINNDTAQASNSVAYLANWQANAAGVQFTAANWQSQLAALMGSTDETTAHVATLVNTMLKAAGSSLYMSGNTVKVKWGSGSFTPTGARSGRGRKSGGGSSGGSGSSSSSNEISEIEKMLDLMEQIQNIRKHQRDLIQETRDYYEATGELTNIIRSYEQERNAILSNTTVLEDNIRKIESLLPAKQKEVASMDTSDDAYEQAAKDLEDLQNAHQEYTKELLENRTAIEELNQSIKEQQDAIRDMEIGLRETIKQAIEDREDLQERMLQGTIDVENEILDVIKSRYERERDLAIETAEAKREALEAERDLLDEQLEARKKLADQEDKQLKLTQLQVKLERISADPTRKKEELELRKEIAELRDEMAWDQAEQEVEAQKDSLDQQIDSLDEYIEYIEQYYEDLFEHPQKLIEEMKSIISKTDEEILAFLKENSEDFSSSTEAAQQDMVNGWNEMLMDMHGSIEDYWDEVEEIIAGGDEAIIEFLKTNSADYKEAGKLQAEAYVDEWKKQLDDLRKAYKDAYEEVKSYDYTTVKPYTGGSGNSSGGSGGSSGGGSSGGAAQDPSLYTYKYKTATGGWSQAYSDTTQQKAFTIARAQAFNHWNAKKTNPTTGKPNPGVNEVLTYIKNATVDHPGSYLQQFALGGLANFTGPAWLDGTKTKPERILSPYQTELFEDMIAVLHNLKIHVSTMPSVGFNNEAAGQTFTFGDVVINVNSLNDESDYQVAAERIMEQIMESMTRGASVGGIRITR